MTQITQKERLDSYKNLDEYMKELYASEKSGRLLRTIFNSFNIERSNYSNYVNIIGDTILGFHKTSELPALLQKNLGVSADDAQRITSALAEFLSPVLAREQAEVDTGKEEMDALRATFEASKVDAPAELQLVKPENFTNVQPLRTMAGDMNRAHGYGAFRDENPEPVQEAEHTEEIIRSASQDDILTKKPNLADRPSYSPEV